MPTSLLSLQKVEKSYAHPSGAVTVLKNLELDVREGETLAILGPSGSGKSTLLSLIAGLDQPDNGNVMFRGQVVRGLSGTRAIGIIFQQFHLMSSLTALENVKLPLELLKDPQADERALIAMRNVGLEHRLHHLPAQLSGGECQRVAIARALVTEPALILADEPSGNLDTQTGETVMNLLFDLVKRLNKTLVLVTHNEELARRCDRQLHLHDGRLT